ncbi:DNA-binding transcriptional regulator [Escherichia coli]|nr:uncharacterized HTH-type transcriptional regulator ycaN domain protein [Escherichia coli 3431]EOV82812.1 hypothetical protein A1UE_01221 [Escherichia coli KTE71]KOA22863.1 transcriptional regulator [Escherichia coli]CTV99681.1 DNA-binding transcriptional regulator [Escherichia coli]CTX10461.1 DNA-binding transcriptional regulator [Escherichia coli]
MNMMISYQELVRTFPNLYERLRPAFDEIQIMLDEMNDFRLTPTGTLKINAARVAARIF